MLQLSDAPETTLIIAARAGDHDAFRMLTEPYSREIHLHCYRMMGSLHDAEDLAQETLLRAWRGLHGFQGRSGFRSWLYRVATNACLNALDHRRRAPPPARSNGHGADAVPHLQPYPDSLLPGTDGLTNETLTPEARYELRESVSLAFQVAIQLLPPRQRAVLILGDVLGFTARETADLIGSTVPAVNSALQRARSTVLRNGSQTGGGPPDEDELSLVERFVEAWERSDINALIELLTDRALLTMPPESLRYVGRDAIAAFFSSLRADCRMEHTRFIITAANRQPALAGYRLDPATGVSYAHVIIVLTMDGPSISALTAFPDSSLFPSFGLPSTR
jgi:RNA polymerase sigma-70 factor (ECF subfamily)